MVVQSLRRAALPWGSLAYCYDFISAHARECRDRAAAVQDSLVPGTVNRARRVQALHVAGGEFHRCLVKHLAGDRPEYARRCMPLRTVSRRDDPVQRPHSLRPGGPRRAQCRPDRLSRWAFHRGRRGGPKSDGLQALCPSELRGSAGGHRRPGNQADPYPARQFSRAMPTWRKAGTGSDKL